MTASIVAAEIVTVDDNGGANYTSIQDAVNNANNGDTILVYSGSYTENLYVDKELTIKSKSGNPDNTIVQAANSSIHVFDVTADNVTISGFNITGASMSLKSGIFLYRVEDCLITNNIILKNRYGIHLDRSSNNKLRNNIIDSNVGAVWFGESSNNNTLINNTVSNNKGGIYFSRSKSNNFIRNTIMNNGHWEIYLDDSSNNNNLNSNNISNNPEYGIYIRKSDNNTLINNTISNNEDGIFLDSSNYNIISNNSFSNNKNGIVITPNSKNNISNNIVLNNKKPMTTGYSTLFILMSIAIALILAGARQKK